MVLERKARESLAQGQNRRAFDGFKRLFKLDPDTYRADLVVTATLYFRDTLGQSKLREARLVLDSLEGIASAPNIAAMGLRLAFLTGDGDAVVALADEILRAPDSLAEDRRAAADGLVTLPPERREGVVWEELRLLDQGLADASAGRLAEAGKPLRGIPRQSPFAHWRLFFKAICAHAEGDASTTAKALASLDGACLALAKAWVAPDLESLATAVFRGR